MSACSGSAQPPGLPGSRSPGQHLLLLEGELVSHVQVGALGTVAELVSHELHFVLLAVSSGVGPPPGLDELPVVVGLSPLLPGHAVPCRVAEVVTSVQIDLLVDAGSFSSSSRELSERTRHLEFDIGIRLIDGSKEHFLPPSC